MVTASNIAKGATTGKIYPASFEGGIEKKILTEINHHKSSDNKEGGKDCLKSCFGKLK